MLEGSQSVPDGTELSRQMAHSDFFKNWVRQTGRIMATVCIGLLAVLIGYKVVFGANGTVEWRAKRVEFQQLQQDIDKATLEHRALETRVKKLQSDPNTIVQEAREKLNFVMPGEVVLVQPQSRPELRSTSLAEASPAVPPESAKK
jgi:cell division protein FtsB